jgi:hypothetical protein
MKARWTMVATLVAVVGAMLAVAGAAFAQPSESGQAVHVDETFVDPDFSSACGFDVVTHDVGVITAWFFFDRTRVHQSIRSTLTNPETGTSVVLIYSGTVADKIKLKEPTPATPSYTVTYTATFTGLNYKVFGADGAEISAGHFTMTKTLIYDVNQNFVDITIEERQTPRLAHLLGSSTIAAICETLAR